MVYTNHIQTEAECLFPNRHVHLIKFICPLLTSISLPWKTLLQLLALAGVTLLLSNLSRGLHACSKAGTSHYVESLFIILYTFSFHHTCQSMHSLCHIKKVGILFTDRKVDYQLNSTKSRNASFCFFDISQAYFASHCEGDKVG